MYVAWSSLHELEFFPASSQGNVNGTTIIPCFLLGKDRKGKCNVLTLSLKPVGDYSPNKTGLVLHHLNEEKDHLVPMQLDLEISGTSGTAEPVSIDAYIGENIFYLAVAFAVIKSDSNHKFFLNIYRTRMDLPAKFALTQLSDHYIKFDMDSSALQITHSLLHIGGESKMAFIMATGDSLPSSSPVQPPLGTLSNTQPEGQPERQPLSIFVHVVDAAPESTSTAPSGSFTTALANEEDTNEFQSLQSVRRWFPPSRKSSLASAHRRAAFSSFIKLPVESSHEAMPELALMRHHSAQDKLFHMDFCPRDSENEQRLAAFGWESGRFYAFLTDLSKGVVLRAVNGRHASPVTQIRFVPHDVSLPKSCNLLVSCGFDASVVYEDLFPVVEDPADESESQVEVSPVNMERQHILPDSEMFDSVLCACVGDVDLDGTCEILLGTFQHMMLVYKLVLEQDECAEGGNACRKEYRLLFKRHFTGPIHSIHLADVTGDGVNEILVTTAKGLHVLQYDLGDLISLLKYRWNSINTDQ